MSEEKKELKDDSLEKVSGGIGYVYETVDYGDISQDGFNHHLGETINVHTSTGPFTGHTYSDGGTVTKLGKEDYVDGTVLRCRKYIYIDTGETDTTRWYPDDYSGKLWIYDFISSSEIYIDVLYQL